MKKGTLPMAYWHHLPGVCNHLARHVGDGCDRPNGGVWTPLYPASVDAPRLTAERDAARAEAAQLREALEACAANLNQLNGWDRDALDKTRAVLNHLDGWEWENPDGAFIVAGDRVPVECPRCDASGQINLDGMADQCPYCAGGGVVKARLVSTPPTSQGEGA